MKMRYLVPGIMLAVMLASVTGAAFVGSASIRAPAVIVYNNTGSLTTISLTITNGNGTVSFTNPSAVANSTHDSAYVAARYGSSYAGRNFSRYNFVYTVTDLGNNVSGPSAGAAMALLAVSAFRGVAMRPDFTITGTINSDGTIGQIGGAIDKVAAASAAGLDLILVPSAGQGSLEQGVYYIAQSKYRIPVVEVPNMSQAAAYAFGSMSGVANEVTMNFSANYRAGALPQARLACSNGCDESPFAAFTNYTINITLAQASGLSALPGFGTAGSQLTGVAGQASMIHQKGYYYISADIAFLDYLDAFYLGSYNMTRGGAFDYMRDVQAGCSSLAAPQLTLGNYEYVIGAELRQGWANYTINSTLSDYNASGATGDDIISSMYSAGQAQAWCGAATFLYGYPYGESGEPMAFSQSLAQVAMERISRATPYQGMYLTLAGKAYREGNYPVAILDADYAYALAAPPLGYSTPASQLINESADLAVNSTYGSWATEFSKEALFYAYESFASPRNSTQAQSYAYQAYTSAYLASQVSNDTRNIYGGLVAAPLSSPSAGSAASLNGTSGTTAVRILDTLTVQVQDLTDIVGIMLALLLGCMTMVVILAHKLIVISARLKGRRRKAR